MIGCIDPIVCRVRACAEKQRYIYSPRDYDPELILTRGAGDRRDRFNMTVSIINRRFRKLPRDLVPVPGDDIFVAAVRHRRQDTIVTNAPED